MATSTICNSEMTLSTVCSNKSFGVNNYYQQCHSWYDIDMQKRIKTTYICDFSITWTNQKFQIKRNPISGLPLWFLELKKQETTNELIISKTKQMLHACVLIIIIYNYHVKGFNVIQSIIWRLIRQWTFEDTIRHCATMKVRYEGPWPLYMQHYKLARVRFDYIYTRSTSIIIK